MMERRVKVSECIPGEILAEDIVINGVKLVSKNTVLNNYILTKLESYYIFDILIYAKDPTMDLDKSKEENYEKIKDKYELSVMEIKSLINQIVDGGTPNYKTIKHLSDLVIDLSHNGGNLIKYLNSLKQTDEYTYTHCINVAFYALLIGKWMNLPSKKMHDLVQAGLLHDIGKIKIPEEILKKPGKLTNEEFSEIRKHTIYGFDIINLNHEISVNVKDAILMHHERLDGTGYPLGITDKDISQIAKIVSVADVFDAITSNRVYKRGATPFKAFEMFITTGLKLFDISVIFAMVENLSAYYVGMRVTLADCKIGEIVYIPPKNVLNPIIKVDNEFIDFSEHDNSRIVSLL